VGGLEKVVGKLSGSLAINLQKYLIFVVLVHWRNQLSADVLLLKSCPGVLHQPLFAGCQANQVNRGEHHDDTPTLIF
jgi:hypothetical protein